MGIASVVLCTYSAIKGYTPWRIGTRDMLYCLAAGIFLSIHFITWITSLKYTSVASSVVLVTTNPIFVAVFSAVFFGEKHPFELVLGVALCVAGGILIALGDQGTAGFVTQGSRALTGDILALTGAAAGSGYIIAGSRVRGRMATVPFITLVYTICAVILIAITMTAGIPAGGYRPSSYLFMVLLALIPQLIGHTSFMWALGHLKAGMVAITILGEPVGATILAWLIFGETVGGIRLMGMVLIFAAIYVSSRKGMKERS